MNRSRVLLYLLFFASGASGLVYEILWVRQFGLLFGSTVYSAALVTSIYMCGLGTGSYLAGRWVDRRASVDPAAPVRAYGLFELGIALFAAMLLFAVPYAANFAASASTYVVEAENGWRYLSGMSAVVRYGSAVVLLTPITLLMGGTLTLLIRHMVGDDLDSAGRHVGFLYGINTAGAALGCLLTDTLFVPVLGLQSTQLLAISLNVFAAVGALVLAHRANRQPPQEWKPTEATEASDPIVVWVSVAIGLSGFAAMAMQILWFRHLISLIGGFRPVFSILLTVILVGIWLGSIAGGALSARTRRPATLYAIALASFVVWSLGALYLVAPDISAMYAEISENAEGGPLPFYLYLLEHTAWVVGPPALLSGMAFPLANAVVQRSSERVGERAGLMYLANTVGGVSGSLLAGFWLLPALGLQQSVTFVVASVLLAILAITLVAHRTEALPLLPRAAIVVVPVIAGAVWMALPASTLMTRWLPPSVAKGQEELLAIREGVNETIAITSRRGLSIRLLTNGYSMSTTDFSAQRYMRAYTHIPMFLSDDIRNVMIMCFGVGNTASSVLMYPSIERLDIVDLSEDILEHSRFFTPVNGRPLEDPRVRVHVNDARHHLRMKGDIQYDLITGEPPPISHAGVGNLYTRNFFALAKTRLRPGGFITYWLPMNQIGESVARATVAGFLEEFPGAVMLSGYRHQLMLVGRKDASFAFDPSRMRRRIAEVPGLWLDLRWLSMDEPVDVVAMLASSTKTMQSATEGVDPLEDDRPLMEYGSRLVSRDRRLPADLFSVEDVESWCPSCPQGGLTLAETRDLEVALELIGQYYESPAFLEHQQGRRIPFNPKLDRAAAEAIAGNLYLEQLAGRASQAQLTTARLLRHSKVRPALTTLKQYTVQHPGHLPQRIDLADLYRAVGEFDLARAELDAIRAIEPDNRRLIAALRRLEQAESR